MNSGHTLVVLRGLGRALSQRDEFGLRFLSTHTGIAEELEAVTKFPAKADTCLGIPSSQHPIDGALACTDGSDQIRRQGVPGTPLVQETHAGSALPVIDKLSLR